MFRPDLHFLVCCCSAFLPHRERSHGRNKDSDENVKDLDEDYYKILGVEKNASIEEIRKAYKKRSLEYHPDKIAQRSAGSSNKEISRKEFQQIKEAYEILMSPQKRQMYDIMGKEAMAYVLNPASVEFKTLSDNLTSAKKYDVLKVWLCLVIFFTLPLIQPILICLKVDYNDGIFANVTWMILLIPLWISDIVFLIFLWALFTIVKNMEIAPSKMNQFIFFFKFSLVVVTQVFLALKFDEIVSWSYAVLFIPIYVYELTRFINSAWITYVKNSEMDKMVTVTFIEKEYGKPYSDMSAEERDIVNEKYIIVHTPPTPTDVDDGLKDLVDDLNIIESPEFQKALKVSQYARGEIFSTIIHGVFLGLTVPNLDNDNIDWSWWVVFIPIWISFSLQCFKSCFTICCSNLPNQQDQIIFEDEDVENTDFEKKDIDYDKNIDNVDLHLESADQERKTSEKEEKEHIQEYDQEKGVEASEETIDLEKQSKGTGEINIQQSDSQSHPTKEDDGIKFENSAGINIDEKPSPTLGFTKEKIAEESENEEDVEFIFSDYEFGKPEEESSAIEATAQAIASCCSVIFYITIVCLFVGKLEAGKDSYSAFWVIFPIILLFGILFCCATFCMICGSTMHTFLPKSDENGNQDEVEDPVDIENIEGTHDLEKSIEDEEELTLVDPTTYQPDLADTPPVTDSLSDFDDLD